MPKQDVKQGKKLLSAAEKIVEILSEFDMDEGDRIS